MFGKDVSGRQAREGGDGRRGQLLGEAMWGHEPDATSAGDQRLGLPSSSPWAGSCVPPLPSLISSPRELLQHSRASGTEQLHHCHSRAKGDILLAPTLTQSLLWGCGTRLQWGPQCHLLIQNRTVVMGMLKDCPLCSLETDQALSTSP